MKLAIPPLEEVVKPVAYGSLRDDRGYAPAQPSVELDMEDVCK